MRSRPTDHTPTTAMTSPPAHSSGLEPTERAGSARAVSNAASRASNSAFCGSRASICACYEASAGECLGESSGECFGVGFLV